MDKILLHILVLFYLTNDHSLAIGVSGLYIYDMQKKDKIFLLKRFSPGDPSFSKKKLPEMMQRRGANFDLSLFGSFIRYKYLTATQFWYKNIFLCRPNPVPNFVRWGHPFTANLFKNPVSQY
jgi:hypothetical protein